MVTLLKDALYKFVKRLIRFRKWVAHNYHVREYVQFSFLRIRYFWLKCKYHLFLSLSPQFETFLFPFLLWFAVLSFHDNVETSSVSHRRGIMHYVVVIPSVNSRRRKIGIMQLNIFGSNFFYRIAMRKLYFSFEKTPS